jgi:hypothetical protein
LTGYERITSEEVSRFLPPPEAVDETAAFFGREGFEVTGVAGMGFSIVAAPALFERVFGEPLELGEEAGVGTAGTAGGALELPLGMLPEEIRRLIQAVTFTPPPDFGPTRP